MQNYKLVLSYDGSRYKGWQRQGNTSGTVQGKVEETLSRILGQPIEIAGAGRTDAGVHARMQVASFRADTELSTEAILTALRRYLPEDIGAESLSAVQPRFHARLHCAGKTYLYRVWYSDAPCVFDRKYVYRVAEPLDVEAMRQAAEALTGEHDFASFHTGRSKKSTIRRIDSIELCRSGDELRLFLRGNGFLYNMVRIIVGTLLEVGAGRLAPADISGIIESKNREQAGPTAPAKGLCLWEVYYFSENPVQS